MIVPSLADLTAFITVWEQKGFSAAARKLGVSPSSLSHSMKNLEAQLGVRLLNRTTRSVSLTSAGEHLLRRANPAIAELISAVNEVVSEGNKPSGSIRISAAEEAARLIIREVLPGLLLAYPDIHVEFVVDTRYVDIVADGFDAGMRLLEEVPKDMIAIEMGPPLRLIAVASPVYLERHGIPKVPQDLDVHRCVRYRFDSGAIYHWEMSYQNTNVSLNVAGPLTMGNTPLMVEAALAGIAIAWVPDFAAQSHIAKGQLVELLPEWSPYHSRLSLYYPANRHQPAAFKLFVAAVQAWARKGQTDVAEAAQAS